MIISENKTCNWNNTGLSDVCNPLTDRERSPGVCSVLCPPDWRSEARVTLYKIIRLIKVGKIFTDVLCLFPEKRKLTNKDQPLWERILHGPSDDIMRVFLMDIDEEEVSDDVSVLASYPERV